MSILADFNEVDNAGMRQKYFECFCFNKFVNLITWIAWADEYIFCFKCLIATMFPVGIDNDLVTMLNVPSPILARCLYSVE